MEVGRDDLHFCVEGQAVGHSHHDSVHCGRPPGPSWLGQGRVEAQSLGPQGRISTSLAATDHLLLLDSVASPGKIQLGITDADISHELLTKRIKFIPAAANYAKKGRAPACMRLSVCVF